MKFLFLVISGLVLFSCSTTPVIRTQHGSSAKSSTKKSTVNSSVKTETIAAESPTKEHMNNSQETSGAPEQPVRLSHSAIVRLELPIENKMQKITSTESFPVDSKKIGIILPITGKGASLSQRVLEALRIGFANAGYSLILFDSEGNPSIAAKGVEKLIKEDHVISLIGGLSAKEATAIAEKAEFYEIPFFTFSQKSDLTKNANYTFRNAVTAQMQTTRLVEYAVTKLGMKKFAILYPNDSYGVEFANAFWDNVLAYGGSITAAQAYDPKTSDFTPYVQKMVGTYYIENRAEEYKQRLQAINLKNKSKNKTKKSSRDNEGKENILEPIVDFDAVFIPDSSKVMGQAMAFFKASDVLSMTYLGTNLWNTDDLFRRSGQVGHGSQTNALYFTDAKNSDVEIEKSEFHRHFLQAHQEAPTLIESQAYEVAVILRNEANSYSSRSSLADRLRTLGTLKGAYTDVYMNNGQEIVRPVSIMGLENTLVKKID